MAGGDSPEAKEGAGGAAATLTASPASLRWQGFTAPGRPGVTTPPVATYGMVTLLRAIGWSPGPIGRSRKR